GEIVVRTYLEEQVMTVGLSRSLANAQRGVWVFPGRRIVEDDQADVREGITWRRAESQHGDWLGLAGHENKVACHAQGALFSWQIGVKNRPRTIRNSVLVRVHESDQASGRTEKICALADGHQERTIGEFRHAQRKIQAAGKRRDAKVVRIDPWPLDCKWLRKGGPKTNKCGEDHHGRTDNVPGGH